MRLSSVATRVPKSGIRQVVEIIEQAVRMQDVIRLEIGEPNFPTPPHIVAAADAALRGGRTRMTASSGLPELRRALADKLLQRNSASVAPEQVLVTNGSTQALYLALASILEPGDDVLIPDPGYPSYLGIVLAARGNPVGYRLSTAGGLLPEIDQLRSALTPRTRVLLLNSPGNPTGAVIDAQRMQQLLDFAHEHDLCVLSDEVYDEIVFDSAAVSPLALEHRDRVISAFSFSKTYSMTGWRLGYAVVPADVAGMLANVHGSMMSCLSTPLQWAGMAALEGPQDVVKEMCAEYRGRRDRALEQLAGSPVVAHRPDGAFYLWLDVSASGVSGYDFAQRLLHGKGVSVAPGSAFGTAGAAFVRVSLAAQLERLEQGIERIKEQVAELAGTTGPEVVDD